MSKRLVAVIATVGVLLGAAAMIAAQPRVEFVAQLGGTALAVDVLGDVAILGEGPRLVTLDLSDPENPVEIGRSAPLPNHIVDLAVTGDHVVAAADLYGLRILSVEDPAHPVEIGSIAPHDSALGVFVVGDTAYLADRGEGLAIVSLEDKTAPQIIGSLDTPGTAYDVVVAGDYAYVADMRGGLRVVSVADPTEPIEVGSCETVEDAVDVFLDGEIAYVANQYDGLEIVSVADPANPVHLASLRIDRPTDILVMGDLLYVSTEWSGIVVVSVADRQQPVELARFGDPGGGRSLALHDGTLLAADAARGLHVFSLSDPEAPERIGAFDTASYGEDILVAGDLALLVDYHEGLHVISVADPARPDGIGFFPLTSAVGLDARGGLAFLCSPDGIVIVDLSDPTSPAQLSSVRLGAQAQAVAIDGDYAYVLSPYKGLRVVSIADPANAEVVAELPLPGFSADITIRDELAFIAAGGIRVVSVADPLHPVVIGAYESEQTSRSLWVDGDRLYFGDGTYLRTLSIEDPAQPVELGLCVPGLSPVIDQCGEHIIVGLGWRGVRVFNLSDPAASYEITGHDTGDRAAAIDVVGDLIYVADHHGGMYIFRLVE